MSLALHAGVVDIAAFVRSYTGYLAEVHARVESPNPADSVRKIQHPQGGHVPFLKHTNKNVIEDA